MVPFDEYVRARGGELIRLAAALTGHQEQARDLVCLALADARREWSRIADEDPNTYLRHGIVRGYLSFWRRSQPARADDPLARLARPQRAVLVLRFLAGLSYLEIAEHLGRSPTAAAKLSERALSAIDERQVVAALDGYASVSPGTATLIEGAVAVARRRSRRRVAVGASVIAAVLLIGALATAPGRSAPQPPPSPPASAVAAPVSLVPAIFPVPKFPYLATYLPNGAGTPEISQNGNVVQMDFLNLSLFAGPDQPFQTPATPAGTVERIWQRDRLWLQLLSDRISAQEADRVVAGLVPGEVTMQLPPFTITLMPAGHELRLASPRSICLAYDAEASVVGLCVTTLPDLLGQASWPVQPVTVAVQGRSADLIYPPGFWAELWIHLGGRQVIRVREEARSEEERLSAGDLVRFAEGIIVAQP